jgi:hypothetical protein
VDTPTAAVEAAESVKVLLPLPGAAMVAGEKLAVTPLGRLLTDNAIAELNPFTVAVVKVIGVDPPGGKRTFVPLDFSVKLDGKTVRAMTCACALPPPVPVTVKVETPAAVPEAADSFKVLLPLPGAAMLEGAKLAVTPCGSPLTDNATAELNPFSTAVVKAIGIELPGATLALVALGVSVKLGVTTVTGNVRVRVSPPPVPVNVNV